MRIAYDPQAFVLQPYGGISRYFTRLSLELNNLDQDVCIFADVHRNYYLNELPKNIKNDSFVQSYPRYSWRLYYLYSQLISRNKIAKWKPDIVHETYYSRFGSSPYKCPTVLTIYDMIHEVYSESLSFFDRTIHVKKSAIARADKIICISENTRNDLMRFYDVNPQKVSVVHLGFEDFNLIETTSLASLTLPHKPFLLFVGLRAGYKNFIGLLKAAASSSRLMNDFDIVAYGGGMFSDQEAKTIKALGFREGQVRHFLGGDENLAFLYKKATVFIYPSLYEGFGMPPLEAMRVGCPVVASHTSSMPEVLGNGANYFNSADIEDIRKSIEQVVYSDTKIKELKKFGKYQASLYSWEKCAKETLSIYRKCV
ncbi:glycosyltransferase family 1 protein [Polynucleobacter sp. AP-Sanab-80-C2]|uniref:glycosyltransferase family 4 protein n=1 Tax=Polynucleobacter sp. AP-Sanab-80-C2 TaxID=3108274 RepID=UPI002B22AE09|nr:glycosyltransferase family 1 protein [Polynucleobacter sp. AP-Sanab-80-C2]MEA9598547.1 glycosyltransferase family 1 protein [Polynucleobacter sp. AP-Sanab-80-C2]